MIIIFMILSFDVSAKDPINALSSAFSKTKSGKEISKVVEGKIKRVSNKYDLSILIALKPLIDKEIMIKEDNMYIKYEINDSQKVSMGMNWKF